jgi:hypothetical protein
LRDDVEPAPTLLAQVEVSHEEVEAQLALLRSCRVPTWPQSPLTGDGTHFTLEIRGENADLTISWWSAVPSGCEGLEPFLAWLLGKAPVSGETLSSV